MSEHVSAAANGAFTVIGAGIVGIACARWLQRDGRHVTVIDPVPPGESCSFGNAAIISMGSVLPFAMPGTIFKVPGWLLDPLGPLAVRWSYLPRATPWFLRVLANSRPSRVAKISDALRALNAPTLEAYRELLDPSDFAELVRHEGLIYVYESEQALADEAGSWALREARGVRTQRLGRDDLRQLEPALAPDFPCGMFVEDTAQVVNPERVVKRLAERLVADGGEIVAARVEGFEIGPDGPRRVLTDQGPRDVQSVVIAAGAWSHRLAAKLGSRVPLEAERGYHVTIRHTAGGPRRAVGFPAKGFIATPIDVGLRVAGTDEFAGVDAPPNYRRADVLLGHAKRMYPELEIAEVSKWMGCRPALPDSLPVIGRSPRFANVYYAFGHGHLGLTEGAMTGKLIAELAAGRPASIDLTPYRVDRF